jgi:two-component system CheB/CheR fusion protein
MTPKKKATKRSNTQKSTTTKRPVSEKRIKPKGPKRKETHFGKIQKQPFIAGIGASAGGLQALEAFFSAMPPDSDVAFVIIQHLDPTYKSQMSSILQGYTQMKVLEIKDGVRIAPNSVYVNPPNKEVALIDNTLQLMELPHGQRPVMPIDSFFRSLAEDQEDRSIGIILSGSGSDGSQGLKAIRDKGGMVLVQDPTQARYDRMPQNAINTDMVDLVLPVEKMPDELIDYTTHPFFRSRAKQVIQEETLNTQLKKILVLIRKETGHDFTQYKNTTLRRRIERRMALNHLERISDYLAYLQRNPEEVKSLFKDILITVTHFFRDLKAYKALAEKVIPGLLKQERKSPVRVWVPGCATGEEAYSLAIIFQEALKKVKRQVDVTIFATDINEEVISHARKGLYPENISVDVSAHRLKQFFNKEGESFRINQSLRKMIVFAVQSITKDPPFTNLDLIACRNLLIYMERELQEKLLSLFHYTLKPGAFLFLGTSESLGHSSDLFEPVDSKHKIFKSRPDIAIKPADYLQRIAQLGHTPLKKQEMASDLNEAAIHGLADRVVLEHYALPCVLINQNHDILYFHGKTDKYLSPPVGSANLNLSKMIHENLFRPLTTLLHQAAKEKKEMVKKGLTITRNHKQTTVDIGVRPIIENKTDQLLMMVVFDDKSHLQERGKPGRKRSQGEGSPKARVSELEEELQEAREYLQATVEELETTNEELKSANEELQSTNEELQSTNEELTTVNAELQNKIEELTRANDDLNNLIVSTEVGVIFLDDDLCIQRFSPNATKLCNMIPSDIGRPITDITFNIDVENLHHEIQEVFKTLKRRDFKVAIDDILYILRILPYRTQQNIIGGVVITFLEATLIKDIVSAKRLATVVTDSNDAITCHDLKGRIIAWNKSAEKMYGYSEAEALQMNILNTVPEDRLSDYKRVLNQIKSGEKVDSFQTERLTKDGRTIEVWVTQTLLLDTHDNIPLIATTERDLSLLEALIDQRNKFKRKR